MHPCVSDPLVENVGYRLRRIRLTIASKMTAPSNVTSMVGLENFIRMQFVFPVMIS